MRHLFMEKGFAHVGMREIMALAGLSPVQGYRLGLVKEELLAEIGIQLSAEQLETITAGFIPRVGEGLQAFTERYPLELYKSAIHPDFYIRYLPCSTEICRRGQPSTRRRG